MRMLSKKQENRSGVAFDKVLLFVVLGLVSMALLSGTMLLSARVQADDSQAGTASVTVTSSC